LLRLHAELGAAHALGDLVFDPVVTRRVCHLRQREGGDLQQGL
jgi:hypothetical protein